MRWKRHGDTSVALRLWKASRSDLLAAYTDRSAGPGACWPWTRAISEHGYGIISNQHGGTAIASRAAYEEANGLALDRWTVVMHSCNNPPCCNPAHLVAGTMAENQAYMAATGRSSTGERNGSAKLTDANVEEMRRLRGEGALLTVLAARFGVGIAQVSRVCNRRQRA